MINGVREDKVNKLLNDLKGRVIRAIVIGTSTGGPKALDEIITKLPRDIGVPIFVVQHMAEDMIKTFVTRLNKKSDITVKEAEHGERIRKNIVYIAKGNYHMEVSNLDKIILNKDETVHGVRPAVDNLFKSCAKVYRDSLLSIVLTGMGKDGAAGTLEVKNKGGYCIVQSEESCLIYGMPKAAFNTGAVDLSLDIDIMADVIVKSIKK